MYLLEVPLRGASYEYPQHMFLRRNQGPVVQSIVSLMSSLVVKILTSEYNI